MNVLPLVSAFILIFAIGSYTFVHNFLASQQEKEHFCAATHIRHAYERRFPYKLYRSTRGTNLYPPKEQETTEPKEPKKPTAYDSPRERLYPCAEARLNIYPLLYKQNPLLEKLLTEMVDSLYALTPFKEERVGALILNLLKESKGISDLSELIAIAPEEKRLLVYQLLKGTQNYTLFTGDGYPALGDYIRIGKETEKAINLCHAHSPLLQALFDPAVGLDIIDHERRKWEPKHKHDPMTREELEELLIAHGLSFSTFEELACFKKNKEALKEKVLKEGAIQIRRKMPGHPSS